jgi:hypothetical protein
MRIKGGMWELVSVIGQYLGMISGRPPNSNKKVGAFSSPFTTSIINPYSS